MTSVKRHGLIALCAIVLFLHQAKGQLVPEPLKPELVDPFWAQLGLADFQFVITLELPLDQVRSSYLLGVAAYDALSVYSDKLHGSIVGGSLRRPPAERTLANKRVAISYAVYRLFTASYGAKAKAIFDATFAALGLNPNDTSTDPKTAVGMGNIVGKIVSDALVFDEWNQLGNRPNVTYNRRPVSDWTGYVPKNTAYKLKFPSRWQPLEVVINDEYTVVQTYHGNQLGRKPMLSGYHPSYFKVPKPKAILNPKSKAYKRQADRIIAISAALNDTSKMLAEFIDGGYAGFGSTYLANKYNWTLDKQVIWSFVSGVCLSDSQIATAYWKTVYDTVRPASVVRMSGLYDIITAWGGPGKGTVTMKASEWRQYNTRTDPSPEYPSGACAFTATYAGVARRLLGTDDFGWSPVYPAGSSLVEPGTPKQAVQFHFPTFTSFRRAGQIGREAGGVHFEIGTKGGSKLGDQVAEKLYEKLVSLFQVATL